MESSPLSRRERRVRLPRALGVAVFVCACMLLAWMVRPPQASAASDRGSRHQVQLVTIDSLLATGHAVAADSALARLRGQRWFAHADSLVWLDVEIRRLSCWQALQRVANFQISGLADTLLGVAQRRGAPASTRGELVRAKTASLIASGMYPEALTVCTQMLEELEASLDLRDAMQATPYLMELAKQLVGTSAADTRRELYEKVCEYRANLGPGDGISLEAQLYLGDIARSLGDWQRAIEHYRQVWSFGGRAWEGTDWRLKRAEERLSSLLDEHGGRRDDDPVPAPDGGLMTAPPAGFAATYARALRDFASYLRDSSTTEPRTWQLNRPLHYAAATNLERLAAECTPGDLPASRVLTLLEIRRRESPSGWRGEASSISYYYLMVFAAAERGTAGENLVVSDSLCRRMFDADAVDTSLVSWIRNGAFEVAASVAIVRRDWKTAIANLQRALAVASTANKRAEIQSALGLVELLRGNAAGGTEHSVLADDLLREEFARRLPAMGFDQALLESAPRLENLGLLLSCAVASKRPLDVQTAWDRFMDRRGAASYRFASYRHQAALQSRLAARRKVLLEEQNTLLVRAEPSREPRTRTRLLELDRELQRLEERARAPEPAPDRRSCLELARSLPDLTVMLSFARLPFVDASTPLPPPSWSDTTTAEGVLHYVAMLLRSGRDPVLRDLGPAVVIDSLVGAWRRALAATDVLPASERRRQLLRSGTALRERLWDPWVAEMAQARMVMVVPDGALQRLPFACLPADEHRYLIEAGPAITYLSHERELTRPTLPTGSGALVVGGADFGPASSPEISGVPPDRGTRVSGSDCADFGTLSWPQLPASLVEADSVSGMLRTETSSWPGASDLKLLTGTDASEAAVKFASAGKRIIHLATHAFVFDRACSPAGKANGAMQNPLLLAGVVLAGANNRASATSADEGLLTAGEIAELDLSATEWAVLSGCDTGAGEAIDSEGVLGLQTAFRIAGVRTLIMSLWPVRDAHASYWMRDLYRARFQAGRSTVDAARAAGLAMIERLRSHKEFPDPLYWGGFITAGQWR